MHKGIAQREPRHDLAVTCLCGAHTAALNLVGVFLLSGHLSSSFEWLFHNLFGINWGLLIGTCQPHPTHGLYWHHSAGQVSILRFVSSVLSQRSCPKLANPKPGSRELLIGCSLGQISIEAFPTTDQQATSRTEIAAASRAAGNFYSEHIVTWLGSLSFFACTPRCDLPNVLGHGEQKALQEVWNVRVVLDTDLILRHTEMWSITCAKISCFFPAHICSYLLCIGVPCPLAPRHLVHLDQHLAGSDRPPALGRTLHCQHHRQTLHGIPTAADLISTMDMCFVPRGKREFSSDYERS